MLYRDPGKALLVRPANLPRPAELLEDPDRPRRDVDLSLEHAVPGTGRVGMVQVVPRLTGGQDRQRPEVRRLVARGERPLADHVTHRVDRPRDVVQQRDPHEPGPEERRDRAVPGARPQPTDERRPG